MGNLPRNSSTHPRKPGATPVLVGTRSRSLELGKYSESSCYLSREILNMLENEPENSSVAFTQTDWLSQWLADLCPPVLNQAFREELSDTRSRDSQPIPPVRNQAFSADFAWVLDDRRQYRRKYYPSSDLAIANNYCCDCPVLEHCPHEAWLDKERKAEDKSSTDSDSDSSSSSSSSSSGSSDSDSDSSEDSDSSSSSDSSTSSASSSSTSSTNKEKSKKKKQKT